MESQNHQHNSLFPSLSSASSSWSSAGSGSPSSFLLPQIFPAPASSPLNHQSLTDFLTADISRQQQLQDMLLHDIDWVALLSGLNSCSTSYNLLSTNNMSLANGNVDFEDKKELGDTDDGRRRKKKTSRPKYEFQTRSVDDVLDDGFRWRKYGQKAVKNTSYPRSYYRCIHSACNVKKQVQRLPQDPSIVVTTYEGVHNHPCEKLMKTLAPLLKQMQFSLQILRPII